MSKQRRPGRMKTMRKLKTSREVRNGADRTRADPHAFEIAKREIFAVHAGLFRRLAEHDRQKDARNK